MLLTDMKVCAVYESLAEGLTLQQLNEPDKHLATAFADVSAHVYANEITWKKKQHVKLINLELFPAFPLLK